MSSGGFIVRGQLETAMPVLRSWRWLFAAMSILLPLALVVVSLTYQGGVWLIVTLACAAAASVLLVELSSRDHPVRAWGGARPHEHPPSLRVIELRTPSDRK